MTSPFCHLVVAKWQQQTVNLERLFYFGHRRGNVWSLWVGAWRLAFSVFHATAHPAPSLSPRQTSSGRTSPHASAVPLMSAIPHSWSYSLNVWPRLIILAPPDELAQRTKRATISPRVSCARPFVVVASLRPATWRRPHLGPNQTPRHPTALNPQPVRT